MFMKRPINDSRPLMPAYVETYLIEGSALESLVEIGGKVRGGDHDAEKNVTKNRIFPCTAALFVCT